MTKEDFSFEIDLGITKYKVSGTFLVTDETPEDFTPTSIIEVESGNSLDIKTLDPQWLEIIKEEAFEEWENQL